MWLITNNKNTFLKHLNMNSRQNFNNYVFFKEDKLYIFNKPKNYNIIAHFNCWLVSFRILHMMDIIMYGEYIS